MVVGIESVSNDKDNKDYNVTGMVRCGGGCQPSIKMKNLTELSKKWTYLTHYQTALLKLKMIRVKAKTDINHLLDPGRRRSMKGNQVNFASRDYKIVNHVRRHQKL